MVETGNIIGYNQTLTVPQAVLFQENGRRQGAPDDRLYGQLCRDIRVYPEGPGNVIALASKNNDRIVNDQYDARRNLINQPEGVLTGNGELLSEANPFRYTSYPFDPEIGLYYLKARYGIKRPYKNKILK